MTIQYCPNCGTKIAPGAKFCPNCGEKLLEEIENQAAEVVDIPKGKTPPIALGPEIDFHHINQKVSPKNKQATATKRTWILAGIFLIFTILPAQEWSPLYGYWGLLFISFFLFVSAILVGFLFRSRAKKMDTLITGENLLVSWTLDDASKKIYVQHLYEEMTSKNKAMYLVIAVLTVIIFGITILVIDEGQLFMAIVGVGLLVLLALFAFGMPTYYKNSNLKGDGIILIGSKYAYLNGYFHNWDFPLSGLEKVKKIKKPFYGLEIHYFFTDRTMTHTMEIQIPAPTNIDLDAVIEELKAANQ